MTIRSQSEKAEIWLARHGIVAATSGASIQELQPPALPAAEADSPDDWASDAQRWYLQRAQGVDVAQLLPYHQTAGK
jgi:hypothetical protein